MHRPAAFALVLLLAAGCASLISSQAEYEMGREEAAKIEAQMGFARDGVTTKWVEDVGRRLVPHAPDSDFTFAFHVVDMEAPNAFALPGGFVYVSRGLLALVNEESELAGVVGHEMGHVVARHSVRRMSASAPFAVVFGVPSAILGTVSSTAGGAVGGIGALAQGAVVAPFSREQEREADRIGQEMAAAAGYDPAGISRMFTTMKRDEALARKGPRRQSWFDTHPATPERVADTAAHAKTLERGTGRPIAATRAQVLGRLDGLVVGPDPARGVFVDDRFLHPDFAISWPLPKDWKQVNTPTAVVVQHPEDERSGLVLQLAGTGTDPEAVAEQNGVDPSELDAMERNGLRAAGIVLEERRTRIYARWVAHRGRVFRILGITPTSRADALEAPILASLDGFRPLTSGERAKIEGQVLRPLEGRAGESLAAFARRTGSAWKPERLAAVNALEDGAPLAAGALLKVPLTERYR